MTTLFRSERSSLQPIRVTLLTPPGRGALAVVGVWGTGAIDFVSRLFAARGTGTLAERPDGSITFGSWRPTGEDVVLVRHAVDRAEIHGHGGTAAPAAVLASLEEAGATPAGWQDWIGGGPFGHEALRLLPLAWGPKAATILCRQASGSLDAAIAELSGHVARGEVAAARSLAGRLLATARFGLRLAAPWRVVLAGRVNAGKSSLMNALVGHARSLVAPVPGTTRDIVAAPAVLRGWAVELVDAAGNREDGEAASATELAGIARAAAARDAADLVVRVVSVDDMRPCDSQVRANELLVVSKIDRAPRGRLSGALATSAVTGEGIDDLVAAIVERLVPEERHEPGVLAGPVPFTSTQVEAIEQLIGRLA